MILENAGAFESNLNSNMDRIQLKSFGVYNIPESFI